MSGPQFQLRVAVGAQPCEVVVAAREEIDAGKRLRVTAIQAFGQSHDGRQHTDSRAKCAVEIAVAFVRFLRSRLTVVSRDKRDDLDFLRIEAPQISILDQIVGVAMMAVIADVYANVVQERRIFQPFTLAIAQAVNATRLIEDAEGQPRDLLRVL
jgi:hypothetical protein